MILDILLETPAFSINKYYFRDRRHKTPEAREWETKMQSLLEEYKELHDFAHMVRKDSTNVIGIEICVEYPVHIYYNKAGQVSSKTYDVTNTEKAIVDQIFNFISLNDKLIVKMVSSKKPGPRHCIKVRLELNPI